MSEVWLITGASRGLARAYGALSLSWGRCSVSKGSELA
jgi:hypothetical protein